MTEEELLILLSRVAGGGVTPDDALNRLKSGPFKHDISQHLYTDHHRRLRQGLAEVVLAEFKSDTQLIQSAEKLSGTGGAILFTRVSSEQSVILKEKYPTGRANPDGRTFIINPPLRKNAASGEPFVAVISAGSSDYKVVAEASEVCLAMNIAYEVFNDVGVAGLHRFLSHIEHIQAAAALVVVAGMEGALPSVVGGVVSAPVFAVPTSVGYGTSFKGIAALLAMLNSCAPGVAVVNIDNGFSAAFAACQVVRQIKKRTENPDGK